MTPAQRRLADLAARIDAKLLADSEADIRVWLDARIRASGQFGVYSFGWSSLRIRGDVAKVDLNRGAFADAAAGGGRGMENQHYWNTWDVMGDWTTRCIKVADWMDTPLGQAS
jgi:hypothetical protein